METIRLYSFSTLILLLCSQAQFCGSIWLPKLRWNKTCASDNDCQGPPFENIAKDRNDIYCAPRYCALHSWSPVWDAEDGTSDDGVVYTGPSTLPPLKRRGPQRLNWKWGCKSDDSCTDSYTWKRAANNDTKDIYCSGRYCALQSWPRL